MGLTRGARGVDGSEAVSFAPATGQGHLTYWTAGACVGCAQPTASVFFPEAHRSAKENDFQFFDVEVSLPAPDRDLANPILNRFLPPK